MSFKFVLPFLFVFFTGAITSSIFEWYVPITTIKITNTSNKVIDQLDIKYRGIGEHSGRIAENLQPGQVVTFKWATYGKASYRLHATFNDGTEVKGGLGYVKRGETIKDAIESGRVMTAAPIWFTFGLLFHEPIDTTRPLGN